MQSTFTLATTTFANPLSDAETLINLSSTSGIAPGVFLFANRELMKVDRLTGVGNYAIVLRGADGTETKPHGTGETVYIAQGYQLFDQDPTGLPPNQPLTNPYINVRNGVVWVVQGDDVGPGTFARTWQPVTTTQAIGAYGVRVTTVTTPS